MRIPRESLIFGGITLATIIVFFGIFLLSGQSSSKAPEAVDLVGDGSTMLGKKDASVALVEFGDYQCPACRASEPIVKQVIHDYKDRIKFVFRHYPLPFHRNAEPAAEAAEAAGEQGKFWEYHGLLYENQEDWSKQSNPRKIFEDYAKELNLNLDQFRQALDEHKFLDKIRSDKKAGDVAGISGTPTFFINQEKLTGGFGFDQFKQKLDQALAK